MTPPAPSPPSVPLHHSNSSGNTNNDTSQRYVRSSNTTANIFLGGVRRSWMLNAAGPQTLSSLSSSSTGRNPPIAHPTTTPVTTAAAPSSSSPSCAAIPVPISAPAPAPAPSPVPAPAPDPAPVVGRSHGPSGPNPPPLSIASIQSQLDAQHAGEDVAISPTSPSRQLLSSLTTSVEGPAESRAPDIHHPSPQSLPPRASSCASTPRSAPESPAPPSVGVPDSNPRPPDDVRAPSDATPITAPLTPASTPTVSRPLNAAPVQAIVNPASGEKKNTSETTSNSQDPPRLPQVQSSLPSQQQSPPLISPQQSTSFSPQPQRPYPPQLPRSHASPPNAPARLSPRAPAAMELPPSRLQTQSTTEGAIVLDTAFFELSLRRLEAVFGALGGRPVEYSRANLLAQACRERDSLFLAMHQLYCLYSYAPAELKGLSGTTQKQLLGFEVIASVLLDNSHLSPAFLKWCVHFPAPLGHLMQQPLYRGAVEHALVCLGMLTDRWRAYTQHVLTRGFPPLVEELVIYLGMQSEALAYTIFLSTCRRLLGTHNERHLRTVWNQDLEHYRRRCAMRPNQISRLQVERENEQVIRTYKSFAPASPPTPTGTSAGVGANGVAQAMTRQVNVPNPQVPSPRGPAQLAIHPATSTAYVLNTTGQAVAGPGSRGHPRRTARTSGQTAGPPFTSSPVSNSPMNRALPPHANGSPHPCPTPIHVQRNMPPMGTFTAGSSGTPNHPGIASPAFSPHPSMPFPSQLLPNNRVTSSAQAPAPEPVQRQFRDQPMENQISIPRPHPRQVNPTPNMQGPPQRHKPPLFLPPPGPIPSNPARPHPIRDSLHQAHLRGPQNRLVSRGSAGDIETELFQYVTAFSVPPTPLGLSKCAYRWQFSLSQPEIDRLPTRQPVTMGHRPLRILVDGSQIYRLRCIRVPPTVESVSDETWSVAETAWPGVIYLFINEVEVFVRRKIHNGKDLPLDITDHLREGTNNISLHFIRNPAEVRDQTYALAVETSELASFARAQSLVQALPASDARERLCKRLSTRASNDDDISIVSQDLTVNLVDPFTAQIFNVPVRGRSCEHPECFDHKTWISTRASKSGKGPLAEDWRCPICGNDARPQSLVIDGFLVEVHAELGRSGRLEGAQAIQVRSDGSWVLKSDAEGQSPSLPSDQATEPIRATNGAKRNHNASNDANPVPPLAAHKKAKVERRASINDVPPGNQVCEVIVLDD